MPPPDRSDTPRDTGILEEAGIRADSNMRHNAERLASWLEFLLHPEEHEYDRTVIQVLAGPGAQLRRRDDPRGRGAGESRLPTGEAGVGHLHRLADALDVGKTKLSGNGLADCTNHSREPTAASISFVDDLPPSDEQQPPQTTTIGDTQVRVYDEEENCEVYWRHATRDYQVVARTPDCDTSKDLAESLMAVLAKAPPSDVAPQ